MSKHKGLFQPVFNFLDSQLDSRWWVVKCMIVVVGCSLFFQFPNFTYLKSQMAGVSTYTPKYGQGHNNFWKVIILQSENPLKQQRFNEIPSHDDVMAYRLTLPVIAWALHLGPWGLYVALLVFNLVFLLCFLLVLQQRTGDKTLAFLITLAVANIYMGCSGFIDAMGLTVIVGYAFLMLAITVRKPVLIFLSVFLAVYSDERALVGSSLVFFWWLAMETDFNIKNLLDILRPRWTTYSVVAAWIAYFITKQMLNYFCGFHLPMDYVGFYALFDMYDRQALSIWTAYEGLWAVLAAYFIALISRRDGWNGLLTVGGMALIALIAAMTHDLTKSLAYSVVVLPIAVVYLSRHGGSKTDLRLLGMFSAVTCILAPTIYIINTIMYTSPLYQEVLLYLKANYYDTFYPQHIQDMYQMNEEMLKNK